MKWEGFWQTMTALAIGATFTGIIKLFWTSWKERERK